MKSLENWFSEYAESHQNETNQAIHFVCVPAIFFSIVGLFMSIPNKPLVELLSGIPPIFVNWAIPALILVLVFYIRLSFITFLRMLAFSLFCIAGNYLIGDSGLLLYISIGIFVIAWIGQFYGHKIEGKKPSFFKDLQFLLIGPAWVFEKIMRR